MKLLFGCVSLNFEWPLNPCNRSRGKNGKIVLSLVGLEMSLQMCMEDLITIQFHYKLLEDGVSTEHLGVSVVGYENENTEQFLLVLMQTTKE